MCIQLQRLPASILGIYGPRKDLLPERMRLLHPDAAASLLAMEGTPRRLRISDMFRSAEASLNAVFEKRGVQRPGYSGHNFGFSIDIDVGDCMRRFGMNKRQLDEHLAACGWVCHRKDHALGDESWHYNFVSTGSEAARYLAASTRSTSTAPALEARIREHYGAAMDLSPTEVQGALRRLRLYSGAVDGDLGPLSRQAIRIFQRAWGLAITGSVDAITARTLAFVAAELVIAGAP